jgi:hypothetical protein
MNEQPELMRRALAIKDRILPELETSLTALGSSERITPDIMAVRIKPPPSNMFAKLYAPMVREDILAGTGTHEFTHTLQNSRVLGTQPEDAATIGKLLNDAITQADPWLNRGSLTRSLRTLDDLTSSAPVAIQQLSRNVNPRGASSLTRYSGIGGPEMTRKDAYSLSSMDEGLATLAEAARNPRADPTIKLLAERLGLGITQKR